MDALSFSLDYINIEYFESRIQKLEDDLYEEAHPSPSYHELISHDFSVSKNGGWLWEAYLEILEEMDEARGEE